ncbi:MAG: AAA family ATPase, partial [Nanoarchaeota archaeon]|nr:AAA family ATPase [Nanoarchaeota archaeon]
MTITLSKDQRVAVDGILDTINENPDKATATVLTGSAGTGKSTTILELIKALRATHNNYYLTAMTHKAAKVVSDITYREVLTVHKLFALKPTVDRRGKEIIKQL